MLLMMMMMINCPERELNSSRFAKVHRLIELCSEKKKSFAVLNNDRTFDKLIKKLDLKIKSLISSMFKVLKSDKKSDHCESKRCHRVSES